MNTYNENLRSSVAKALQSLDQDLKKVNANANASMFTLYYSQGATFTAIAELEDAKNVQDTQEGIKTEAVNNSNLSGNLLKTATQAGTYLKQSVSNVSVGASNIQGAANAIVRLSGDVGNIYNIVNAADFDTDIYKLAREANVLINETAYAAERASQLALEASVLTSKVSAATVQDNAKNTNDAVNSLLKIVSDDYDKISKQVNDDNAKLAAVSTSEKAAEGVYEDLRTVSIATANAYKETNDQLNLALSAAPVEGSEDTKFKVEFNWINSPFFEKDKKFPYPVQNYFLFVVKDKQKSTFSINSAEDIRTNHPEWCINLSKDLKGPGPFGKEFEYTKIPSLSKYGKDSTDSTEQPVTYHLHDSEGDEVTLGTDYVVFLFAVYEEEYKKKLNTYDDFLSAPSKVFSMSIVLQKASFTEGSGKKTAAAEGQPVTHDVTFSVQEREDVPVEYRCIFLPAASALTSGLMDEEILKAMDKEINDLRIAADKLQPEINKLKSDLLHTASEADTFRQKYTEIFSNIEQFLRQNKDHLPKPGTTAKKQEEGIKQMITRMKNRMPELAETSSAELKEDLPKMVALLPAREVAEQQLSELQKQQADTLLKIEAANENKIDFIFNLALAEQVSVSNYYPADPAGDAIGGKNWKVAITPATTDNFGNVLVPGKPYIPVVLSVSKEQEEMLSSYTNTWTGYGAHEPIYV